MRLFRIVGAFTGVNPIAALAECSLPSSCVRKQRLCTFALAASVRLEHVDACSTPNAAWSALTRGASGEIPMTLVALLCAVTAALGRSPSVSATDTSDLADVVRSLTALRVRLRSRLDPTRTPVAATPAIDAGPNAAIVAPASAIDPTDRKLEALLGSLRG